MRQRFKFIGVILALFLVAVWVQGCATTPKQKQLQVLKANNRVVRDYIDLFKLQDKATQDKWRIEVTPLVKDFDDAVTAYDEAVSGSADQQAKFKVYENIALKLFDLFGRYGITIKEE